MCRAKYSDDLLTTEEFKNIQSHGDGHNCRVLEHWDVDASLCVRDPEKVKMLKNMHAGMNSGKKRKEEYGFHMPDFKKDWESGELPKFRPAWLSSDWFSYSGCITILLFFNWSNIMAPNSRPNLLYENDDIDRIHSFEKQGRISSDSWDAVVTDFIPFRYEKSFNRWASSSDSEFLTSVRFLLWLRCINHRLPDNSDSLCEWIQNLLSYRQKSQIEPNPFIISSRRFES